jgi:N-acetylglutamate synthase-like GNAT family acetyltransferase
MIEIRRLKCEDILDCVKIVDYHWTWIVGERAKKEIEHGLSLEGSEFAPHYHVAVEDGKILGFAGFRDSWIMHNVYELIWINVHKDHINKGIGKKLTAFRLRAIEDVGGTMVMLMTKKTDWFTHNFGFKIQDTFGPWSLMTKELKPTTI